MRLSQKILMVTIATLSFSLLLSSAVNIFSFRSNYTDSLLTGSFGIGYSIESVLNELLDLGLTLESLSGVDKKLADAAQKNPHIEYAGVTDLTGLVLFHNDPTQKGQVYSDPVTLKTLVAVKPLWQTNESLDGASIYDVAIPIMDGGRPIGVIRLGFSSKVIDEKVIQAVSQMVINVVFTFIIIALLLNFFLRKQLVEPIKSLSGYAAAITNGRFGQPVKIGSGDELATLSNALENMGSTIKTQIDELKQSSIVLEEKVEARTQQLEETNKTLQARNHSLKHALKREQELYQALRLSEERFRMLFEANRAVMLTIEPDSGAIVAANKAAIDFYGYTKDQLLKMLISDINALHNEDVAQEIKQAQHEERNHFYFRHALASGDIRDVEVHSGPIDWNGKEVLYLIIHDVTDRKRAEEELEHIAYYDPLTGLPNRRLKSDRLRQAIAHSKRNGTSVGVCYMDLDGFKTINDRFGHETGDMILVKIAERLQDTLREQDTISRIGGDEFVLILSDLTGIQQSTQILDRVLEEIARPITIEGTELTVSGSIGLTLYPEDDSDPDILLRHADQAMYWAKEEGKNCYHLFDPHHNRQVKANRENFKLLKDALVNEQFVVHYQPKIDMYSCDVIGLEALIRWEHPDLGLKLPGEFLSLIATTELELEMGKWIFNHVLKQIKEWFSVGIKLPVSVNISAYHLQSPDFADYLRGLFKVHPDVSPDLLELEVLETASIEDTNAIYHTLSDCREMGVKIVLDDFGTGYSSLAYFHRLPVDILKIDQSFVQSMLDDPQDFTIVDSVVRLSQAFQHPVIAEGVESIQHASALLQLGCRLGQGFGIARPMPAGKVPAWLEEWKNDIIWQGLKHRLFQNDEMGIKVAIASHRAWVENIINYIEQNKPINRNQLDSKHCRFNYWLHGLGFVQYGDLHQYLTINRLHEEIHNQGNKLVSLKSKGSMELAQMGIKDLIAMSNHFVGLIRELDETNKEVI
jgi:diguanylate cyclase (GGDEF)-like protein/PAS domain S-box-containing protein